MVMLISARRNGFHLSSMIPAENRFALFRVML
jgi:hypothetical protein